MERSLAAANNEQRGTVAMSANAGSEGIWIICDEQVLCDRIENVIQPIPERITKLKRSDVEDEMFWKPLLQSPGLIVIDVDSKMDWGLWVLRRLKKARVKAPIIAVTKSFSREFGEKILSEGVRYYFSHEFCTEEFREVAASLLKAKRPVQH